MQDVEKERHIAEDFINTIVKKLDDSQKHDLKMLIKGMQLMMPRGVQRNTKY